MEKLIATVFLIGSSIAITNAQTMENTMDLEKLIMKAYHTDQENRTIVERLLLDKSTPQDSLKKYAVQLKKSDMVNQKVVLPILDKYIAREVKLSDSSLNAAYYIVQHASKEDQEKYSNFVGKLFKKQVIDKNEYTRFVDRVLIKNCKAQVYLKQAYMDADVKDIYPFPLRANAKEIAKNNNLLEELEKEIDIKTKSFPAEYAPVFVVDDEFVVFGHIKKKEEQRNVPVSDVEISYGGKVLAKSNKNGFYSFKIIKSAAASDILFTKGSIYTNKNLDSTDKDWQMVDVLF
ncbi:hypothetical protein [Sphingobacterium sp.]|uniref:hypothetical protein n=1 Tax=Sphingobacterium sp. TaxID=341027 RepID=UPI0031CF2370